MTTPIAGCKQDSLDASLLRFQSSSFCFLGEFLAEQGIFLMLILTSTLCRYMIIYPRSVQTNEGVTSSWNLQQIELDTYYAMLIPLTLPVALLAVYANWLSLELCMNKHD